MSLPMSPVHQSSSEAALPTPLSPDIECPSSESAIPPALENLARQLPHGKVRSHFRINRRLKQWILRQGRFPHYHSASHPEPTHGNAPPRDGGAYEELSCSHDGFHTKASIADDGRLDIRINQKSPKLSALLAYIFSSRLTPHEVATVKIDHADGYTVPPPLNIVMQVVGSRGDVQPFVSLGQLLKTKYGHRVRIATHPIFKQIVEENGLEFFSIGGDPAALMAFMVKNPGLIPSYNTLRHGDVGKRRKDIAEILTRCWRSCIEAGDGAECEDPKDSFARRPSKDGGTQLPSSASRPFVADAIIANPVSFAHLHCAEKLGIPLHMMFTMPWSPTRSFPHPLANIQSSNADSPMTNLISYTLVEMMTWQGLGDVINRFRKTVLNLNPIGVMWAPALIPRLHVPYTYCWSPALISKPQDWGAYIDISGFFFLPLAAPYSPADDLTAFLAAGPPPIYIGFGSIVVDDPYTMTKLILDAVRRTGQRALISKGWGALGVDEKLPENVFLIGDVPHEWLFKHVSCVVHHGGAGTTAAGIAQGRPTVVIPFFGDQMFWGAMVARAGAGPTPIPYKGLTPAKLAAAIIEALTPEALQKAVELAAGMIEERGAEAGAESFHRQLHTERCSLIPTRAAVWQVKRTRVRLSVFAAFALCMEGLLNMNDLRLLRQTEYDTEDRPWGPLSGAASTLLEAIASVVGGMVDFPAEVFKAVQASYTDPGDENLRRAIAAARDQSYDLTSLPSHVSSAPDTGLSSGELDRRNRTAVIPAINTATLEDQRSIDRVLLDHLGAASGLTTPLSTNHRTRVAQSSRKRSSRKGSGAYRHRWQRRSKKIYLGMVKPLHLIAASKDVLRIIHVMLTFPMDLMMSLARGCHNAPLDYGDDTVRPPYHITDLRSGLKAGVQEFAYGIFDGVSGLVTQPLNSVKQRGPEGLLKGIGKGLIGLLFKPASGVIGLPTYTIRGLGRQAGKLRIRGRTHVERSVVAARTAQGYEEWQASVPEERMHVVRRWHSVRAESGQQNEQRKMVLGTLEDKGLVAI